MTRGLSALALDISYLRSLENMAVRVSRMVMAMASLSAMLLGGRKRASQEMVR